MRLRFWNSSQSSTLVMMEGCLDRPKTSAPRRKTRVATYWFAPLIRLTTAITAATPMTTPMSVRTLRSLCAQRLEAEMATASDKFIVVGRGIEPGNTTAPHPSIRAGEPWDYRRIQKLGTTRSVNGRKQNGSPDCRLGMQGLLDLFDHLANTWSHRAIRSQP